MGWLLLACFLMGGLFCACFLIWNGNESEDESEDEWFQDGRDEDEWEWEPGLGDWLVTRQGRTWIRTWYWDDDDGCWNYDWEVYDALIAHGQ